VRPNLLLRAVCVIAPLVIPTHASAHTSENLAGGFVAGFSHPLAGADHLFAMVAVGLWGAILGRPLLVLLPVIFPTVMALGAVAAIARLPGPPIELGIALSVLILGLGIAARLRPPVWLAGAVVAAFAICHGYAHGLETPSLVDPVAYSTGFMLATGSLHVAGIGLGTFDASPQGALAIRVLGGMIALSGVYFFFQAVIAR
jgi:urease accessory protein